MAVADLHIHSKISNGTMSPEEIFLFIKNYNNPPPGEQRERIGTIAITDHEQFEGALAVQHAAEEEHYELEVWYGIELRTRMLDSEVDILGYWFNPKHDDFRKLMDDVKIKRRNRNKALLEELRSARDNNSRAIEIGLDELESEAMKQKSYNPDIRHIVSLMTREYSMDENEANKLVNQCPIEVQQIQRLQSSEIINRLNNSGGIAVYAHPGLTPETDYRSIARLLVDEKIGGMEVFHPENPKEVRDALADFARDYSLLIFGGSDAHGPDIPGYRSPYPKRIGSETLSNEYLKKLEVARKQYEAKPELRHAEKKTETVQTEKTSLQ